MTTSSKIAKKYSYYRISYTLGGIQRKHTIIAKFA